MQPLDIPHDVIIAGGGAGPVGLLLACKLRLAGVSVMLLERASDPHARLNNLPFGLHGLSVPTIESLARRDLLADLEARAASQNVRAAAHWIGQPRHPAGHFTSILESRAAVRSRLRSFAGRPQHA